MKHRSRRSPRGLRRDARSIFEAAIARCSPERLVAPLLPTIGEMLSVPGILPKAEGGKPILILGYGKAVAGMARAC